MNCNEVRDWVLLSETNEAAERRSAAMEQHLAQCRDCREYRAATALLTGTARNLRLTAEPSAAVLARIRAEAEAQHPLQRPVLVWRPMLRRALGLAASMMLVVGTWFYYMRPAAVDSVGELHALLSLLGDPSADGTSVAVAKQATDEGLQHLGARLIELEGLEIDDGNADMLSDEELKELEEPDATDLPENSTDASLEEMHG
jgi:predicted anti-sigma-YlaC factor YlaD